jgi:very-short-patch-repair endonuclease
MTRSARLDSVRLGKLLDKQYLVIARAQTLECGMTDEALRYRIRAGGLWQRLLPGVYLAMPGTPGFDQRDMAALLYAGAGSVITGPAALRRYGIKRGIKPQQGFDVDVLVPASKQPQSTGFVRIHRSVRTPGKFGTHGPIRFALAPRAVADAARELRDLREVRAVVADCVQHRWCSVAELAQELRAGPVAGSALLRQGLAEVADGVRSTAEADLLDLVREGRLPMPMLNARLFVGSALLAVADAWWPDARVVVEVDSREWHLSPEDWEKTLRRHARMSAQGILVLHFTPRQLRTEPAKVIATIRAALEAARAGGQPAVRALPAAG